MNTIMKTIKELNIYNGCLSHSSQLLIELDHDIVLKILTLYSQYYRPIFPSPIRSFSLIY